MNKDSNEKLSLKMQMIFVGIVAVLVWAHLLWDHFHGGVPSHHIMQRQDLPRISNWWGGIVVPLMSWFLLFRIRKRVNKETAEDNELKNVVSAFLAALLFGILLSFFYSIGSEIPGYMMMGALLISFFTPLYKAEFLLGFILGMTYVFGGILPTGVGIIFIIILAITYKVLRKGILYLLSKTGLKKG